MSRLKSVTVDQATGQTAALYSAIKGQLGGVPNLFQALGTNAKVLETYLGLSAAQASLSGAEKEAVALAVAQANSCAYCLAAHTALGKMSGLSEAEMISIRQGKSNDSKRQALVRFAREVVLEKGNVSDETLKTFKAAGYSESQVPEVVLAVVQNIFTNYFNHVNQTEVDFPAASKI